LEGAQAHLVKASALAKGQSEFLDKNLAEFVLQMELLIGLLSSFEERV